jgi:hypothetical protein
MSEPQSGLALEKAKRGKHEEGKGETLTAIFLISVWVIGYAVILGVFRITKILEGLFGNLQMTASGSRVEVRTQKHGG